MTTEATTPPAATDPAATTTTTPTPAAPPATPPAPPPTTPVVETKDAPDGKGFTPTGHAGLDLSLSFFHQHGLTEASPEIAEAAKGNFSYLEAKLASLGEKAKGWEQYLSVAKDAYKSITEGAASAKEALIKQVHEFAGGEDNWKKIKEHVETHADQGELDAINAALKQGGIVARAMVQMLHSQFTQASGTTVDPASVTVNQSSETTNGGPLTLTGYRQELNALVAKFGPGNLDANPAYQALRKKYAGVSK